MNNKNLTFLNILCISILPAFLNTAQTCGPLAREIQAELEKAKQYGDVPGTLLLLKIITDDAVTRGEKNAPDYNLCELELKNSDLFCKANIHIPRAQMPQLKGKPLPGSRADELPRDSRGEVDATNDFAEYLEKTKGYKITVENVPATRLKATQNEIIGSKVAGIWEALQDPTSDSYKIIMSEPFYVSNGDYILDGHHRWAAAVALAITQGNLKGLMLTVKRVHVGIKQLVDDANQFTQDFGIQAEEGLAALA